MKKLIQEVIEEYKIKQGKYIDSRMGEIMIKLPNANIGLVRKRLGDWFNINIKELWIRY